MLWSCTLPLSLCFTLTLSFSLNVQNMLVTDVLKYYHITYCIWLLDLDDVLISHKMKHIANNNIFTVAMADDDLSQYLKSKVFLPHKEAIVGDLDSLEWKSFMTEFYHYADLAQMTWVIFHTGNLETMKKLRIPYNCQFILAYQEPGGYGLYEFYQMKGRYRFVGLGNWSTATGLQISSEPFYNRRLNFYGTMLTLLRSEEEVSEFELAQMEIWFTLGQMMNFSTHVVTKFELMQTDHWISPDVSSQVTVFHAIGLLKNPFLLFSIAPIWKIAMFMYVRSEEDHTSKWMAYIRPFSSSVWRYLALTLVISSACIIIVNRKRTFLQVVEFGLTPVDSMSNQCGSYVGKRHSKRIATAIIRFLAVILIPAYSGVIISTLTLRYPILPFKDLVGLVNDGSYTLGALNTSFGLGYFEYSQNPLAQKVATELFVSEATMPTTYQEGLARSCAEKFAFLAPEDAITNIHLSCQIIKLPTPAFITFAGMPLAPYSEFKRIFFRNLIRLQSAGIVKKLGAPEKLQEIKTYDTIEVTLEHICPLVILLVVGTTLATLVVVSECNLAKKTRDSSEKSICRKRNGNLKLRRMEKLVLRGQYNAMNANLGFGNKWGNFETALLN